MTGPETPWPTQGAWAEKEGENQEHGCHRSQRKGECQEGENEQRVFIRDTQAGGGAQLVWGSVIAAAAPTATGKQSRGDRRVLTDT